MNGIVHFASANNNRSNMAARSWMSNRWWQVATAAVAVLLTLNLTPSAVYSQTEASDPATEADEPLLKTIAISGKCMGPIKYEVTVVDPPNDLDEATLKPFV